MSEKRKVLVIGNDDSEFRRKLAEEVSKRMDNQTLGNIVSTTIDVLSTMTTREQELLAYLESIKDNPKIRVEAAIDAAVELKRIPRAKRTPERQAAIDYIIEEYLCIIPPSDDDD